MQSWFTVAAAVIRHYRWRHWKNSAKFVLRSLLAPAAMLRFCHCVCQDRELLAWALANPSLFSKPQRPYLDARLSIHERVDCILGHYRHFRLRFPAALRRQLLITRSVPLVVLDPSAGGYRVMLERREQFEKEGELVLRLYRADRRNCLCTMAFTLGDPRSSLLSVGCIQGAEYDDALPDIKLATRGLEGLRPPDFLLEVLQRLAWTLDIQRIRGTGRRRHIYACSLLKRSAIRFDYDRFWREGNALERDGLYTLACSHRRIDIERYPSRKRAMIRRRQALLDEVQRQLEQALIPGVEAAADPDPPSPTPPRGLAPVPAIQPA